MYYVVMDNPNLLMNVKFGDMIACKDFQRILLHQVRAGAELVRAGKPGLQRRRLRKRGYFGLWSRPFELYPAVKTTINTVYSKAWRGR